MTRHLLLIVLLVLPIACEEERRNNTQVTIQCPDQPPQVFQVYFAIRQTSGIINQVHYVDLFYADNSKGTMILDEGCSVVIKKEAK